MEKLFTVCIYRTKVLNEQLHPPDHKTQRSKFEGKRAAHRSAVFWNREAE